MARYWPIALAAFLAIAMGIFALREPLVMRFLDLRTEDISFGDHVELIAKDVEIRMPTSGRAPYPVVLQFHGCAGIREPFQHQWAEVANDAGYAAVIVDSNGPRGISRDDALETVCAGTTLLGQERAADVAAAIEIIKQDQRLDESHLVLAGWSHGGWSVMDFLTMNMEQRQPASLSGQDIPFADIMGAIIIYPHCGIGSLSRFRPWAQSPPTLALIAGNDTIVDADECIRFFKNQQDTQHVVYPEAEHVFDDPFLEPEYLHWHNPEYFADAKIRYRSFLISLSPS